MQHMELLINPASGLCNMRCRYCFHADEVANRDLQTPEVMSPRTRETPIRECFSANSRSSVHFTFQGGEPTQAGLDSFRQFVSLVDQYNQRRVSVRYMQFRPMA